MNQENLSASQIRDLELAKDAMWRIESKRLTKALKRHMIANTKYGKSIHTDGIVAVVQYLSAALWISMAAPATICGTALLVGGGSGSSISSIGYGFEGLAGGFVIVGVIRLFEGHISRSRFRKNE